MVWTRANTTPGLKTLTFCLLVAIALAALVMATVLVLCAPMAEAKNKHHHRHPAFNVVRCPTEADGFSCVGTAGNDHLIGRAGLSDEIRGKEGNDLYEGDSGPDTLFDESTTSSDTYVFKAPDLVGGSFVEDCGGGSDIVDLSSTSFRLLDNGTIARGDTGRGCTGAPDADELILDGPEGTVTIVDQYGDGKVETIKFANGTLTF